MCGACIAGNVHDTVCMRLFAAGLLATGLKDEAAGVYYSLLQEGADRAQQVACSDCSSLGVCIWQIRKPGLPLSTETLNGTNLFVLLFV